MSMVTPTGVNMVTFPYTVTPIADIQPFSYQAGLTYQEVLTNLRDWLTNTLVPYVNTYATNDINAYNTAQQALATAMDNFNTTAAADIANIEQIQTEVNTALTNATTEATNAANSATAAATSEVNAAQSATNAANSATLAGTTTDSLVDGAINNTASATYKTLENLYDTSRVADITRLGGSTAIADNSAAFLAALDAAKASIASAPGSSDPVGHVVINIPAGVFTVTSIDALLGVENMTAKASGIKFRGQGTGITTVVFSPSAAGALLNNNYWLDIQFENLTFVSTVAGCTFLQSYTTNNAQRIIFDHVSFSGWKYVIDLQGTNNNSEFFFKNCHNTANEDGGAFFHVGATNTSDQFLNYWFYGCTHWSTSAPFIDVAAGGHFHIFGLDVSDWGGSLTSAGYVFALRGIGHAYGVTSFTAEGVRVEAKNADAALLYSEWNTGNVSLQVDWSSQLFAETYNDIIDIVYANTAGPVYDFHDSWLAGGIHITYGINDFQYRHIIRVRDTTWSQRLTPSEVVSWTDPGVNLVRPRVEFENCRGDDMDIFGTNGASTWDAYGGSTGDNLSLIKPRSLNVMGGGSGIRSANTGIKINLPVGALITGVTVVVPGQNQTTSGIQPVYTLATTESTPTTVATLTATNTLATGFFVEEKLAIPFLCLTRQQATLTIASTGDQAATGALTIINGYW